MKTHDEEYLKLVNEVLTRGVHKPNRTGVDTISIFGYQMRFDLRDGTIPLLTTKKMHTRSIFHEIIWYLSGSDNIKYLKDNNVTIWDEWARPDGSLGPVYGVQWRKWPKYNIEHWDSPADVDLYWVEEQHIDQVAQLIHKLRTNPNDRRLIVSAWNVGELEHMTLPPCHYAFQFYARPLTLSERYEKNGPLVAIETLISNGHELNSLDDDLNHLARQILDERVVPQYELSMMLNQRSCDVGLGVPFNIAQYSTLLRMVAHVVNMTPGEFIWNGGDIHIYTNHVEALKEQSTRTPYPAPRLILNPDVKEIDDFKYEDFNVVGYQSHPTIKMDVAV